MKKQFLVILDITIEDVMTLKCGCEIETDDSKLKVSKMGYDPNYESIETNID